MKMTTNKGETKSATTVQEEEKEVSDDEGSRDEDFEEQAGDL